VGRYASLFPVHLEGLGDDIADKVLDALRSGLLDQDGVVRFATLPSGTNVPGHPEGIAADEYGNIYVATFEFTLDNVIYIFNRNGRLRTTLPLPDG